jgi:hypothetical protein
MGDVTHYYDAMCKLHQEDLASDVSYPEHAYFDHIHRELIGESIIDALADVEETIAGARTALIDPQNLQNSPSASSSPEYPAKPEFVEVNACLPNRPGALATYVAELAGIGFQQKSNAEIGAMWRQVNELPDGSPAFLLSYQYLRDITLDPERKAFALTGYATLIRLNEETPAEGAKNENLPLVVRVFANDGRHYVDRQALRETIKPDNNKETVARILRSVEEPLSPGVPDIIDRLTKRPPGARNQVSDFHQVMLDPQSSGHTGDYACPGMTICRIAAFQEYIVASNSQSLQSLAGAPNSPSYQDAEILHARNYFCCNGMKPASADEVSKADSPYARIFCCCRGDDHPGLLAMVLNSLLFRAGFTWTEDPKKDWVINIDYFKDITCQNPHFSLNRLFGFFVKRSRQDMGKALPHLPLHLLRILPIGSMASAKQWYYYARTLHHFLNTIDKDCQYKFYWLDGEQNRHEGSETPRFNEEDRSRFPVVLVIKFMRSDKHRQADPKEFCELCGVQSKEYDCSKLRVKV